MTSLWHNSRRTWLALMLALSLTVLPGLVAPLLGDEVARVLPGPNVALADNDQGSGG